MKLPSLLSCRVWLALACVLTMTLAPSLSAVWQCEGQICGYVGCCCVGVSGHVECELPTGGNPSAPTVAPCDTGCACTVTLSETDAPPVMPAPLLQDAPCLFSLPDAPPAPRRVYLYPVPAVAYAVLRGPPVSRPVVAAHGLRGPPASACLLSLMESGRNAPAT